MNGNDNGNAVGRPAAGAVGKADNKNPPGQMPNGSDLNAGYECELFDQTHSYGLAGHPTSGRLLLLSCGGLFDNRTGHYESNIFVFALPV